MTPVPESPAAPIRCPHCGGICQDSDELEILHRGCRLKAIFPECCKERGPLLIFDMSKVSAALPKVKP